MPLFALGTVLLTLASAAHAETLAWQDCLSETLLRNPELAAANERLAAASERATGAYSPFLPQLTAEADWSTRTQPSPLTGDTVTNNNLGAGLTARQNLFAGWKDSAALGRTRAERILAEAELQDTSARLRSELAAAFARLSFAQDALGLAQTILSRRQENVRLVELRFDAGRENKGSVLRSRAAARQAQFEVSQAGRAIGVQRRELARVLGRTESTDLIVSGRLPTVPVTDNPDLRNLADHVPATRRARAAVESASSSVQSARSPLFPAVDAFGRYSRAAGDWPPDENRLSTGLTLSYPFFPGGRTTYDIRSARAEQRRAESTLKDVRERAAVSLEEALADYRNAVEKSEVQKEFLEAARLRAEIGRGQYTSGLLSFLEWDIIENDLISMEKAWLAAQTDVSLAQAAWLKAQGKGLEQ